MVSKPQLSRSQKDIALYNTCLNVTDLRKGSSRIVSIFRRVHRVRWVGRGVNGRRTLFLNVDFDAMQMHFHTESLKINIFNVLFWEGGMGSRKRVLCVRF